MFHISARNRSFLAKLLWNVHSKIDSLWIQWVHHYYIPNQTIWEVAVQNTSSPLWKSLLSLRDDLLCECGGHLQVETLLQCWASAEGNFTVNAHEFLRHKTDVLWARVVWEQWSLLRYAFVLWLVVLGKLKTKDRLSFLQLDPICVLCSQVPESHLCFFFLLMYLVICS